MNKMVLGLIALLVYFWYVYVDRSVPVPEPTTGKPDKQKIYSKSLDSSNNRSRFLFRVDSDVRWEHDVPPSFIYTPNRQIIPMDVCYRYTSPVKLPATGKVLYEYLKAHPATRDRLDFQVKSEHPVLKGQVYYFECGYRRIKRLGLCHSGTIFQNGRCVQTGPCTGLPDGTRLPDPKNARQFFVCENQREKIRPCQKDEIFFYDKCVSSSDMLRYCKFHGDQVYLLDPTTRMECRDGKLIITRCSGGKRFFDKNGDCESTLCMAYRDGSRVHHPGVRIDPFHFFPGYTECNNNRVSKREFCPQTWDEREAKDGLLHLPMVFNKDTKQCEVPTFCENVFSQDPKVIVPLREFTVHLKNWGLSRLFDRSAGYMCDVNGKRKLEEVGELHRVGKRFRQEDACDTPQSKIPVYGHSDRYYDCDLKQLEICHQNMYFDGKGCRVRPPNAFEYKSIPIFNFTSLNYDAWIKPYDYQRLDYNATLRCSDPETSHLKLYSICSHPECEKYAFLSTVPDLAILLPIIDKQSQKTWRCRFDEASRRLKKEEAQAQWYDYWEQKPLMEGIEERPCEPGQNLKTGNFVWDRTVFATCNPDQPFVFCPSVHTSKLVEVSGEYACGPPDKSELLLFYKGWVAFEKNEVKHIRTFPQVTLNVQMDKKSTVHTQLTEHGMDVPLNQPLTILLKEGEAIFVKFRHRVTYPPHISFEYDDQDMLQIRKGHSGRAFLMKANGYTENGLNFPVYRVEKHVHDLWEQYRV